MDVLTNYRHGDCAGKPWVIAMGINYNAALPAVVRTGRSVSSKVDVLQWIKDLKGVTALIRAIFKNLEVGFFYDPNDLSTMFQDAAGTVPVTDTGQPVGLVLDKSGALALGSELKQSALAKRAGTAPVATFNTVTGVGTVNRVDISNQSFILFNGTVGSKWYKVSVTNTSAGAIQLRDVTTTAVGVTLAIVQPNTTFSGYVYVNSDSMLGIASSSGECGFTVNSIKEITGNHAFQTVSASRPILGRMPEGGVRNILVSSADKSTAFWAHAGATKTVGLLDAQGTNTAARFSGASTSPPTVSSSVAQVSGAHTVSIHIKSGNGVFTSAKLLLRNTTTGVNFIRADLNLLTGVITGTGWSSRQVANGFWECTYTQMTGISVGDYLAVYLGNTNVTTADFNVIIGNVQLEAGTKATTYQATRGLRDVTEAGKPDVYYLYFDGVDDFLQTNSINFTSTDKVSLFAGVLKTVSGKVGAIFEFSSNPLNNYGTFGVYTDISPSIGVVAAYSRGTATVAANVITTAMAISLNVQASISQKMVSNSINGKSVVSTQNQGAGNYGNYPIYIGRRGGSEFPFNGQIYSLIGVGRLTTDAETAAIEKELAKRIGVTF